MAASILDKYPDYETTIGIEVHTQLATNTKIFCTCLNQIAKDPNSNICQICAGHPGVMPVLNEKIIDYAILAGLATHSTINETSTFDRKHYFYPDLPKNFQITQQAHPICTNGFIPIRLEDGSIKNIRLIRIHIEEDAGKNLHSSYSNESFVDLNRAGTPLFEFVTHPDISSTYEARAYLKMLHLIVQYLGICSGNMEEGAFRADINISVRKKGEEQLGTKCELKNINSFKFITDAIEYELERQIELVKKGTRIISETRLWDQKEKRTFAMRSKEETADYRFMQEPDLPPLYVTQAQIEAAKKTLPELPLQKLERFITAMGLSKDEAEILIEDIELGRYFDTARTFSSSANIINWILRDLISYAKDNKVSIADTHMSPARLAKIADLVDQAIINNTTAKELFIIVAQTGQEPEVVIEAQGLKQIGSADEIEAIVKEVIAANPQQAQEYRSGKEKLFGFFVGQMMQKTKGKGNPQLINDLLKKHLQ